MQFIVVSTMSDYFRALAWGIHSPINTADDAGCVLWLKARINDRLEVLAELPFQQMTESRLSEKIRSVDVRLRVPDSLFAYTVASPEIFPKPLTEATIGIRGEYVSERLANSGIDCVQGDLDTLNGWSRIHALMEIVNDKPRLTIDQSCSHLIKALESGMSDDNDPDVLSQEAPALTALRLAVMSRPAPSALTSADANVPAGSPKYYMNKWKQSGHRRFGAVR